MAEAVTKTLLEPLYTVTHTFLGGVLQQDTLPALVARLPGVDLSRPGELYASLTEHWEVWLRYLMGYAVLTGVGALFVVLLPLVGLCACACRCTGRCGGRTAAVEPPGGRCRRTSCCLALLLLATVCLAGTVCATLTNLALRRQTQPAGAISHVQDRLADIDDYIGSTAREMDDVINSGFANAKEDMFNTLDSVPERTRDVLGDVTHVSPLLDVLNAFTRSLSALSHALERAHNTTEALRADGSTLSASLATLRADIGIDLALCGTTVPECARVQQLLPDLAPDVNFNTSGSVSVALLALNYVISDNITAQVVGGLKQFDDIAEKIGDTWANQVDIAKTTTEHVEAEVGALVAEVARQIAGLNLTVYSRRLEPYKEPLHTYGEYRFYASVGLSVVLGAVVLLIYTGLACGTCCHRPSHYKKVRCSTGSGANFLLAAAGFIYLFAWAQMLVTMGLFLSGGLLYTELCRHLEDIPRDPVVGVVDKMLMRSLNLSLSIQNVTSQCEQNASVYNALELERFGVNISEILDLDSYGMYDVIGRFKRLPVDIGTVVVFSENTENTLGVLEMGLNTINFTQYYSVLAQNLTRIDLDELAAELDAAASQISTRPLADGLSAHASALRTLRYTALATIDRKRAALRAALGDIANFRLRTPISELSRNLSSAQDELNRHGNMLIMSVINVTMDQLSLTLSSLMASLDDDIRTNVGRCAPVHEAVTGVVGVGCREVLDPLNGFWAAHGWCLVLFLPMLAIALKLAGYYRVPASFSSVGHEGDRSAVPYEAYANAPNGESVTHQTTRTGPLKMHGFRKVGTLDRAPYCPPGDGASSIAWA